FPGKAARPCSGFEGRGAHPHGVTAITTTSENVSDLVGPLPAVAASLSPVSPKMLSPLPVDVTKARQRRPTRSALYANRSLDTETALHQLRNRRTVVEQRQGAAAHVGERLLRVDA